MSEICEIDLGQYEHRVYSQGGEDGVIEFFFKLVPPKTKYCVEFGAADGVYLSNTYLLRMKQNWNALLLESTLALPEINLHQELIDADNINEIFRKYQVPAEVDFVSIDIDFNDFYVWRALSFRPALVCIEFNNSMGPTEDKIVVYDPMAVWNGSRYFGASATALYLLGREKGYSLVYIEKNGLNCFFVRDDIIEDLAKRGIRFKNVNDVSKLFIDNHGVLPPDPLNRPYTSSKEFL